jgi:hypothetical protein
VVETANDLAIKCTAAALSGADFPSVWDSVLRAHPLLSAHPFKRLQTTTFRTRNSAYQRSMALLRFNVRPILRFVGSAPSPILGRQSRP